MHARKSVIVLAALALMTSVLLVAPAAADHHTASGCDSDYVHVDGKNITVLPSGGDDTANLQCALDLGVAMPWARVMLVEGDYYTSFLEAEGFHGVFRGESRHKTTLKTLPDGLDCIARGDQAGDLALVTFAASRVNVKGINFAIGGAAACQEPYDEFEPEPGVTFRNWSIAAVLATTRLRSTDACPGVVDHKTEVYGIGVESEYPDFSGPVIDAAGYFAGVIVGPPGGVFADDCFDQMRGTTIVRGSHFTGNDLSVILAGHTDSHDYVGGRHPWQGNVMNDVSLGVLYEFGSGGRVVVGQNKIIDAHNWGVLVFGDPGEATTTAKIIRNHIRGIDDADGIGALDLGPLEDAGQMLNSKIGWNKIEIDDTPFNGIVAVGTDGRILNNKITGKATTGIMLDGLGFFDEETEEFVVVEPSTGWRIAKNWFPRFDFADADIWLWPSTANNTVECAWWGHQVVDLGVDNELIGCGESGAPTAATQAAGVDRSGLEKALANRGRYGR